MAGTINQKHFLQGIINVLFTPTFPARITPTVAYIRLSNVYPEQTVTIDFVHADTEDPLFSFKVTSPPGADPLGVYTLVVPIPAFVVPEGGRYMFRAVSSSGDLLAMSPILVQGPPETQDRKQP